MPRWAAVKLFKNAQVTYRDAPVDDAYLTGSRISIYFSVSISFSVFSSVFHPISILNSTAWITLE